MLTPRNAHLFQTPDPLVAVVRKKFLPQALVRTKKKQRQSRTKTGEGGLCLRITACYAEAVLESHLSRN